jgi:integrase
MLHLAERWGMRPDGTNPTKQVERFKERSRERDLSTAELACLGEAERLGPEAPGALGATRLLLRGLRTGEVLAARWGDIDCGRASHSSVSGARESTP